MSSIVSVTSPEVPAPPPGTWSNCLVVDGIAYLAGATAPGDDEYSQAKGIFTKLKHLVEAGLIKQVHFGGGKQAHYDFVNPADAHDHLVDLDTGQIIPFSSDLVVKLREEIARKMGYTAVSHRFQIIARRQAGGKADDPSG